MVLATPEADSSSRDKILRLFGRFIGVGYLIYFLLLTDDVLAMARVMAPWWTVLAVIAVFGTGFALLATSLLPDIRWIWCTAVVNAAGYLVAAVLWWLAWDGTQMAIDGNTWIAAAAGLASLAAATVWRPAVALAHMFVLVTLVQLGNQTIRSAPFGVDLVPDLAIAWAFCGAFVAAASMASRTGRTLDGTIVETHQAAAAAAVAQARSVERERLDALVHDTVLATLLVAARQSGPQLLKVTDQARSALDGFDNLRFGDDSEAAFDGDGALSHLRSAASQIDEGVRFRSAVGPNSAELCYPGPVVRSIGAAIGEAMRNSVHHAGAQARREVDVLMEVGRLTVTVRDDGMGFDPDQVSELRLGLAVSIRGRMAAQPGGSATVRSKPGSGAVIELGWVAP